MDKFRNGEGTIIITNYENKYFSDSTKVVVESYSSRGSENVFSGVRCKKSVKDHVSVDLNAFNLPLFQRRKFLTKKGIVKKFLVPNNNGQKIF